MSKHADLNTLLANTSKAIKKGSIQQLNNVVVSYLKNPDADKQHVTRVIDIVCDEYSVSKKDLKHSIKRGNVHLARKMAYCLLHFDIHLTTRDIAENIFGRWQTSVASVIKKFKTLDTRIKHEREFLETYQRLQIKISQK